MLTNLSFFIFLFERSNTFGMRKEATGFGEGDRFGFFNRYGEGLRLRIFCISEFFGFLIM